MKKSLTSILVLLMLTASQTFASQANSASLTDIKEALSMVILNLRSLRKDVDDLKKESNGSPSEKEIDALNAKVQKLENQSMGLKTSTTNQTTNYDNTIKQFVSERRQNGN